MEIFLQGTGVVLIGEAPTYAAQIPTDIYDTAVIVVKSINAARINFNLEGFPKIVAIRVLRDIVAVEYNDLRTCKLAIECAMLNNGVYSV